MAVFWDVARCSLVEFDGRFRTAYCHQHRNSETSVKFHQTTQRNIPTETFSYSLTWEPDSSSTLIIAVLAGNRNFLTSLLNTICKWISELLDSYVQRNTEHELKAWKFRTKRSVEKHHGKRSSSNTHTLSGRCYQNVSKRNRVWGCGLDSTGSRQRPIAGTFELTFEFQKNVKLLHQSVSIFQETLHRSASSAVNVAGSQFPSHTTLCCKESFTKGVTQTAS
jgi:hypothetical protein